MGIKEVIELEIHHLSSKVNDLDAHDPHRTKDQECAIYWCGRQTGAILFDFLEGLKGEGIINLEEMIRYQERIRKLYRHLDYAYQKNKTSVLNNT